MVIQRDGHRCPVVLYADDFHCGGTQLILLRSDTLSSNDVPIAHNDPELQLCPQQALREAAERRSDAQCVADWPMWQPQQPDAERLAREIRSGRTPVLTADKFNALVQADVFCWILDSSSLAAL